MGAVSAINAADLPVTLPRGNKWAAKVTDYDESTKYNWVQDFISEENDDGDLLIKTSDLSKDDFFRVSGQGGKHVIFKVARVTPNEVCTLPVPAKMAKVALQNDSRSKSPSQPNRQSTKTTRTTSSSTSSSSSSRSSSKSWKDYELSQKATVVGKSDWMRDDIIEQFDGNNVFGYLMITTTGSDSTLHVPRDKLLDKMNEAGFPSWMAPSRIKPHQAFPRACRGLLQEKSNEITVEGYNVTLSVESNGGRYDKMLVAKKQIPDEEAATDGGDLEHINVARIEYDKSTKSLETSLRADAAGTTIGAVWEQTYRPKLHKLFEERQKQHNGNDVNNIMSYFVRYWTDSVRVRDAVYFVPALYDGLQGMLEGFNELYEWLNIRHKDGGQKTECHFVGVSDASQHKKLAESAMQDEIQGRIDSLFDNVIEEMVESDTLAEQIAEEVLAEEADEIGNLAERYSRVSSATIDVKKMMRDHLREMKHEKADVVGDVLDEMEM